jgi:hypothetical protein
MREPFRKATYAALIAAGATASAQFWSRALTVRDGLPTSRVAVPAVDQREVPATILRASVPAPRLETVPIIRRPLPTWIRLPAPATESVAAGAPNVGTRPSTPISGASPGGSAPQTSSPQQPTATPSPPAPAAAPPTNAQPSEPVRSTAPQTRPSHAQATRAKPATPARRSTPPTTPASPATPATPATPPAHPEHGPPSNPGHSDAGPPGQGNAPAAPPGQANGHGNGK